MTTIGIESQQRVGQPGDRIGRAGARRDQHAADLAGRARIALGGMNRALLVAHQDVLDLLLLEQRVIDRQHRAARIAENVLHALVGERLDHHFGAGHFPARHASTAHVRLIIRSTHSIRWYRPGIKKGPKSPLLRTATSRVAQPPPAVRLLTITGP